MSTHPAVKQVQDKVVYHIDQLDKEVRDLCCPLLSCTQLITMTLHSILYFQLSKYPVAHQFEQKTQVPKAWAFIGVTAVVFFSLFINALAQPISNLIGWALPAYLSVKAIETPGHEDDVQWLTYWVAFGVSFFFGVISC